MNILPVCARTYAVYNQDGFPQYGFDLTVVFGFAGCGIRSEAIHPLEFLRAEELAVKTHIHTLLVK